MKAAQLVGYGLEEVKINDIPKPQISEGKIVVEVYAAGVNPFDWKLSSGMFKNNIPLEFPFIPGGDFSGKVSEIGDKTNGFKIGDEVYGDANALAKKSGSFAEFALTTPQSLSLKPKKLSFIAAGSLPLVGVSSIMALIEHMNLSKGQKILIHGGAGGIGSISIQIAKDIGAYVAATVKKEDVGYVKKLGADEIIDYQSQKFEEILNGYDAVFDTVGKDVTNRSVTILKKGGILVSMIAPADEALVKKQGITAIVQQSRVNTDRLNKLTDFVEKGAIKIHVEKVFPLTETSIALSYLKNTPPQGKVVISMKSL